MESAEREYLAMAYAWTSGSTPCTAKTLTCGPELAPFFSIAGDFAVGSGIKMILFCLSVEFRIPRTVPEIVAHRQQDEADKSFHDRRCQSEMVKNKICNQQNDEYAKMGCVFERYSTYCFCQESVLIKHAAYLCVFIVQLIAD